MFEERYIWEPLAARDARAAQAEVAHLVGEREWSDVNSLGMTHSNGRLESRVADEMPRSPSAQSLLPGWRAAGGLMVALREPGSTMRRFLDQHLGLTRPIQARYRSDAPPLRLAPCGAPAGTMGMAADWILRFATSPHPDIGPALAGAALCGVEMVAALLDVADQLGATVRPYGRGVAGCPDPASLEPRLRSLLEPATKPVVSRAFDGPMPGSAVDSELLLRGCWVLAVLGQFGLGHGGELWSGDLARYLEPDSDLWTPRWRSFGASNLLDLASHEVLSDLTAIREVIMSDLLPVLAGRWGLWETEVLISGSGPIGGAYADLVAAGHLVELKTGAGVLRSSGERGCSLLQRELYQLVGYVLLDTDDVLGLDAVTLCQARFGYVVTWSVEELIAEMSGGLLDLNGARARLAEMLATPSRRVGRR